MSKEIAQTYAELCKQRCEWCAKELPKVPAGQAYGGWHETRVLDGAMRYAPCTAPSPESAYAELATRAGNILNISRRQLAEPAHFGDTAAFIDICTILETL